MSNRSDFEQMSQGAQPSLAYELWLFIKEQKKWWLLPVVAALMLLAALVLLAGTGAAPFIYTIF